MRLAGLAIISLFAVAGCGGGETTAPAETTGADLARDGVSAAIGGMTGMGVSTSDLPDFVEIPPGAKALTNLKINSDGKIGGTLSLETNKTADELVAFYRTSMANKGLKIAVENEAGQMRQLMAESEDKSKSLMVMVLVDDAGKTTLAITHSRAGS